MNIAIIPARGGSKRIPRKNIKNFCGKPIIAYSIEAAKRSGLFSEIFVSTDDPEIAEVAKAYGASVPIYRSQKNSDDFATLSDVVDEVKKYYNQQGINVSYICCILATVPFLTSTLLDQAYSLMIERDADSVRPIVSFPFPVQRALLLRSNGQVAYQYPEYAKSRSQDLEEVYHDAGMFYWMRFDKGLHGEKKFGLKIPREFAEDIDTTEDWKVAEIKYQVMYELNNAKQD